MTLNAEARNANPAPRAALKICVIGSSSSVHVQNRTQAFIERGHQVQLLTLDRVRQLSPISNPLVRKFSTLRAILSLYRSIRSCPADIVHIHYAGGWGAWLALLANRHPLVISVMGGDILFGEQDNLPPSGRWLTIQLLREADLITAKSDYLATVLERLGIPPEKVMTVIWGIDLQHFRRVPTGPLRDQLGLSPQDHVILSPRILRRFYNVHLIIEALPRILNCYPTAKLLITEYRADPIYKEELLKLIDHLTMKEHVLFVGAIDNEEMPKYYSLADVAVGIPPSDGLPQALLEAMACGVPNVISRLARYEEVVTHLHSAYFVDLTVKSVAEGIMELLGNRELSRRIAQNGLDIVHAKANLQVEVDRVEDKLYQLFSVSTRKKRGIVKHSRILFNLALFALSSIRPKSYSNKQRVRSGV